MNYSRANSVDYGALQKKLTRNEMSAVLDVLIPTAAVVITTLASAQPHYDAAFVIRRYGPHTPLTLDLVFRNMARFLQGKPLLNHVRPELGY